MQSDFTTQRLLLSSLTLDNGEFILELVNTPGWLRFIGDRNINTVEDAAGYINRVNQNQTVKYWVVALKDMQTPVGIITFIKREYLEFPDIGFAFLPAYTKFGYAFEAASVILNYLSNERLTDRLLATTIPDNTASIGLLGKLGFQLNTEIEPEGQILLVYGLSLL